MRVGCNHFLIVLQLPLLPDPRIHASLLLGRLRVDPLVLCATFVHTCELQFVVCKLRLARFNKLVELLLFATSRLRTIQDFF